MRKFAVICKVSEANQETIYKSLLSQFSDFEDAVQYYCALQSGCEIIITRNGSDFKKSQIPIMTAQEYLTSIKK
jgi:predicted nucleic acid-binding protein